MSPSSTPPSPDERPTTRTIARRAGLSSAAVSMALRHHPRISAATRERVLKIAAELGYQPDPQVAKLMRHLQVRRKPRFQSVICAFTSIDEGTEAPYIAELFASCRQRAESFGYGFDLFRLPDTASKSRGLSRVLRARGVEGILVLPLKTPRALLNEFEWSSFAAVTATYGALSPELHRIVPDHFANMLLLCENLSRLGYRRIGLVLHAQHDLRVHHGYSAAVAWQNLLGGTELIRPLVHAGTTPTDLRAWFELERPDVIIGAGQDDCHWMARELNLKIPGPVGFAAANREQSKVLAGIDERPSEIGSTAIELLHAQLLSGARGIPAVPTRAMIPGRWVPGTSVRTQRAEKR